MTTTGEKVLAALQPYKLQQVKANQWRGNSPFRPDSDSLSFVLTIEIDGEHGAYFDHVTHESGSLYGLAERLGIDPPERLEVASTKRKYNGIADYAAAHGLPAQALIDAGWYETNKDGRPALAIPTNTGTRFRFLD
jgi:hypothetical protein